MPAPAGHDAQCVRPLSVAPDVKIFVTGTDGYIGSVLGPELIAAGHEVHGLDTGYYKSGWLYHGPSIAPVTVAEDLRNIDPTDLEGFDAVVHLAELSNDPLSQLSPELTYRINHEGSVRLAEMARKVGITRFVYMSSCSVYGIAAGDDLVTETSDVNPQTPYAECKVRVENDVIPMTGDDFAPTFLRNATAYGASPRMRFDIVLNNLCGYARTTGQIRMISDGSPWRPLVHILDISKAIRCVLEAPHERVAGQVFNVGSTGQNYRVREIAETVAEVFTGCELTFGDDSDNRSYRVGFDKIAGELPGFSCDWDARRGARQLRELYDRIDLTTELFESRHHTRLKQLDFLLSTGQIDDELFWVPVGEEI